MRIVGACKERTEDYFKPIALPEAKVTHAFHDHHFTFLKGTEVDVTQMFPTKPLSASRARSEEAAFREGLRDNAYPKAPYLAHVEENYLKQLSSTRLLSAGWHSSTEKQSRQFTLNTAGVHWCLVAEHLYAKSGCS